MRAMKRQCWTVLDGGKICTEDISTNKTLLSSLPDKSFTKSEEGILILSANHLQSADRASATKH